MNRKQRLIRGSILLIIGLLLAGLSIYFNFYYNKNNEKETINEEMLLDYLGIKNNDTPSIDMYLDLAEEITNPKEMLQNVDLTEKILFALEILEDSDNELSKTNIENIIKTYFYTENINLEDINCSCGTKLYTYDSETNLYEKNEEHLSHIDNMTIKLVNKTHTYKKENNKYILNIKKLYAKDENNCFQNDTENCEMKYFDEYNSAIQSKNELFRTNSLSAASQKFYELVTKKYTEYTYTFIYENNNIILEDYKKTL